MSLDTIGNAYFCRMFHTEVAGLRTLRIFTNTFHLPRTRTICDAVFTLPLRAGDASSGYSLAYVDCGDAGMSAADMEPRYEREAASLAGFQKTLEKQDWKSLGDVHTWLYTEHAAYSSTRLLKPAPPPLDAAVLSTY